MIPMMYADAIGLAGGTIPVTALLTINWLLYPGRQEQPLKPYNVGDTWQTMTTLRVQLL